MIVVRPVEVLATERAEVDPRAERRKGDVRHDHEQPVSALRTLGPHGSEVREPEHEDTDDSEDGRSNRVSGPAEGRYEDRRDGKPRNSDKRADADPPSDVVADRHRPPSYRASRPGATP